MLSEDRGIVERYDARELFGEKNEGFRTFENGADRKVAIMAVFGGEDALPGATPEDAALLKVCLEGGARIKDCMVKMLRVAPEAVDPAEDLQTAWENLDLARTIISRLVAGFHGDVSDGNKIVLISDEKESPNTVDYRAKSIHTYNTAL